MTEALSDVLEAKGYDVALAYDGVQAVERVQAQSFDCVLMDIRMPRMSGVDALKVIRKVSPSTAVILMTAYTVQDLIEEARREGVLAVLQKPVAVSKIVRILEELKGGTSALIVDSSLAREIRAGLNGSSFRLVFAANVEEAIHHVSSGSLDAVFLDVEIEGLTAPDALVLFRKCDPKCFLILLSATPPEDSGAGAFATIRKPFKIKEVLGLLERIRARKLGEKLGTDLFEV